MSKVKGPLELYHLLAAVSYQLPNTCCKVLDFLRLTLPWAHPTLNSIFYSFIGKQFRSKLLINKKQLETRTNQSNHPWLRKSRPLLQQTSVSLSSNLNLNVADQLSPKSDSEKKCWNFLESLWLLILSLLVLQWFSHNNSICNLTI